MLPVPIWDQFPTLTWREKVGYITHQFLKLPQTECPVKHIFEGDMYIRDMFIPKDTLFTGRAHLKGHRCDLLSGSVVHISPEGKRVVEAPFSMHSTPAYHMVLYTLTDVVGRTYHPAHGETDVQKLEDEYFESVAILDELGLSVEKRMELTWQV